MYAHPPSSPSSSLTFLRRSTLLATTLSSTACDPTLEGAIHGQPSSNRQASLLGTAAMSLGDGTTCVATYDGSVECWGRNDLGQLGQSNLIHIGDDETPEAIPFVELGGAAQGVLTNGEQTFALMKDGSVRAWGANDSHELGLPHTEPIGDDETPASATVSTEPSLGGVVLQLAVGSDFACARLEHGGVRCWGANDLGQLGYGYTSRIGDDETPASAGDIDLGGPALDITAGAHHACAVLEAGRVRCWGSNDLGQLGYGHTEAIGDDETPASAEGIDLGGSAVRIVAGGLHTCALLGTGAARCWGDGQQGQLGHGKALVVGDDEAPAALGDVPVGGAVVRLVAGWQHTCAVLDTGGLRCWGDGGFGQLGYGTVTDIGDDETPAAVGDVDLGAASATAIYSGALSRSTCVRLDDGAVRCWGDNDAGQLGQGHIMRLGDEPKEVPGDLPNIIILDDDDE
jgi:alpha-tubulin suppressor-like RCC1 family protein